MSNLSIVTGGSAYVDIDLLACAAAYAEVLRLIGIPSQAILTPPYNLTIPQQIHSWDLRITRAFLPLPEYKMFSYILVDVSDPAYFETFVFFPAIIELFDHHLGHKDYWTKHMPLTAHIEPVGACATLIWERIVNYGLESQVSIVNKNLLYTAILANTLNFQAAVTVDRDRLAAQQLEQWINLPKDWKQQYYTAVEQGISFDLQSSIATDTKTILLNSATLFLSQLELWNGKVLLVSQANLLESYLDKYRINGERCLLNLVSIQEGKSYLLSNTPDLLRQLSAVIEGKFYSQSLFATNRLWLRKELIHKMCNI